jgi:hypothetical protein
MLLLAIFLVIFSLQPTKITASRSQKSSVEATTSTTFTTNSLSCSNDSNTDSINSQCALTNDDGSSSIPCVPGLNYIGRGYDISYGLQLSGSSNAIRDPIFTFSEETFQTYSFHGNKYTVPTTVTATEMHETTVTQSVISGYFNSVKAYQLSLSSYLNLQSVLTQYPPRFTSSTGLFNSFLKSVGISSSYSQKISQAVSVNYGSYLNTATIALFNLQLSRASHPTCTTNAIKQLEALPVEYDEAAYLQFIEIYGTHIIIGATLGGYVSVEASGCTSTSSSSDTSSILADLGSFTVYSSQSSTDIISTTVYRSSAVVCGGDSSEYLNPSNYWNYNRNDNNNLNNNDNNNRNNNDNNNRNDNEGSSTFPWSVWSDTLLESNNAICTISFQLAPIYVLATSPSMQANLEKALMTYSDNVASNAALSSNSASCASKLETSSWLTKFTGSSCFSSTQVVEVENEGTKQISSVKVGDRILSLTKDGNFVYSPIIAIPHVNGENHMKAIFINITVQVNSHQTEILTLTVDHLLPIFSCPVAVNNTSSSTCSFSTSFPYTNKEYTLKYSEDVEPGKDCVYMKDNEYHHIVAMSSPFESESIHTVITLEEFIVVNGIVASPFGINHQVGQWLYFPFRFFYSWIPSLFIHPLFEFSFQSIVNYIR